MRAPAVPQTSGPVVFRVPGKPVPQGSMKAFVIKGKPRVTHNKAEELHTWRQTVGFCAREAGAYLMKGPLAVTIQFVLPRPKNHYGTGRNAGRVKESAPRYPTTKPDIDKLVRSVLDALTYVCYSDDSQVAQLQVRKDYADLVPPMTRVAVVPLEQRS